MPEAEGPRSYRVAIGEFLTAFARLLVQLPARVTELWRPFPRRAHVTLGPKSNSNGLHWKQEARQCMPGPR